MKKASNAKPSLSGRAENRMWTNKSVIYLALIAGAAFIVYTNTLTHGFVFDDIEGILNRPIIASFNSVWQMPSIFREPWRAMLVASYAITHCFFGFSTVAFHLTNILIHVLNMEGCRKQIFTTYSTPPEPRLCLSIRWSV
jgi:hypothetical protein